MEELLEFLQVDLEKDFGYHDDEAIAALAQSISELRKSKMHLPRDPPPDSEKPTRPFGYLLHSDNVSLYTINPDNQSTLGSIILRPDGTSVMESALTSSEEDVCPGAKASSETKAVPAKATACSAETSVRKSQQSLSLNANEISDEIRFIDSTTNALNTPELELGNYSSLQPEKDLSSRNGISEIVRMVEEMEREQFGSQTTGSHTVNAEQFGSGEVVLSSATSVLVALRGTASDSEDFMQDWPDSRSPYTLSTDHKDTHFASESSAACETLEKSVSPIALKNSIVTDRSVTRRTSIPKLVSSRQNTSDAVSPTHSNSSTSRVPSFIPRVMRSPTSGDSRSQQVTISGGKEIGHSSGRRGPDQEKVRIYVPYEGSSSKMSRVVKGSNALPAVDT